MRRREWLLVLLVASVVVASEEASEVVVLEVAGLGVVVVSEVVALVVGALRTLVALEVVAQTLVSEVEAAALVVVAQTRASEVEVAALVVVAQTLAASEVEAVASGVAAQTLVDLVPPTQEAQNLALTVVRPTQFLDLGLLEVQTLDPSVAIRTLVHTAEAMSVPELPVPQMLLMPHKDQTRTLMQISRAVLVEIGDSKCGTAPLHHFLYAWQHLSLDSPASAELVL